MNQEEKWIREERIRLNNEVMEDLYEIDKQIRMLWRLQQEDLIRQQQKEIIEKLREKGASELR